MPDRTYNNTTYSFNGKEDEPFSGWQDYGFRNYDKKQRRFTSVDPLTAKYPELTTFQFASNCPISGIDLDGLELQLATKIEYQVDNMTIIEVTYTTMLNDGYTQAAKAAMNQFSGFKASWRNIRDENPATKPERPADMPNHEWENINNSIYNNNKNLPKGTNLIVRLQKIDEIQFVKKGAVVDEIERGVVIANSKGGGSVKNEEPNQKSRQSPLILWLDGAFGDILSMFGGLFKRAPAGVEPPNLNDVKPDAKTAGDDMEKAYDILFNPNGTHDDIKYKGGMVKKRNRKTGKIDSIKPDAIGENFYNIPENKREVFDEKE